MIIKGSAPKSELMGGVVLDGNRCRAFEPQRRSIEVPRGAANPSRSRLLISAAASALVEWHRSYRRLPAGTLCFECGGSQRSPRLCRAGEISYRVAICHLARNFRHLSAGSLSRSVWNLHLVAWRIECRELSLDRQLDVHRAALDRNHGLRLHDPACMVPALQR